MGKKFKKETIASKAGIGTDIQHGAIVPPLYLGTNFEYEEIGKEPPYEYSRQGNPTRDHLIQALSDLEEGLGGEILSSGMAAISLVANILELKSKVILPHDCYGGTFRLFSSLAVTSPTIYSTKIKEDPESSNVDLKALLSHADPALP